MGTAIEWCEETWNPITGCTPISEGCAHCYAQRMAKRLAGRYGYPRDEPFRPGTFHLDKIDINLFPPGKSVFVCSMGDFFHEAVTREMRQDVYAVVDHHPDTLFLFLTKRPQNVMSWWIGERPNVWLGVTVENDKHLWRIVRLLQIPAAKRFVSLEPMLGPIPLRHMDAEQHTNEWCFIDSLTGRHTDMGRPCPDVPRLDWVICGGETGPGARPMHPDWVRGVRDQCLEAGVPFFLKSWGDYIPEDQIELPTDNDFVWRNQPRPAESIHSWFFNNYLGDFEERKGVMCVKPTKKIGKALAGRLLDGREWNERPEVNP